MQFSFFTRLYNWFISTGDLPLDSYSTQEMPLNLIQLAKMDVTRNVFHIKYGSKLSTAFLFYHKEHYYLVSAAHALPGIKKTNSDEIEIFRKKEWCKFNVKCVNVGNFYFDSINRDNFTEDLAILTIDDKNNDFENKIPFFQEEFLPPLFRFEMNLKEKQIFNARDVYYLGFPLGLSSEASNFYDLAEMNAGFPMPFLKKGIISNFGCINNETKMFYLDSIVNKGFSGGPAFFIDEGKLVLLGVITRFEPDHPSGNSGIGGGIKINKVVELIEDANPNIPD